MKIKFNSDDDSPLKKEQELHNVVKVFRSVFHEGNKYNLQVLLDKCLYKLQMLDYDKIDGSERSNFDKTTDLHECDICYYWYFLKKKVRFQAKACTGCHNLTEKLVSFDHFPFVSVKGNDYRNNFCYMSKDDAKIY